MSQTKGNKKSRALELTQAEAGLLSMVLSTFIEEEDSGRVQPLLSPKNKTELRVLQKRARELAK